MATLSQEELEKVCADSKKLQEIKQRKSEYAKGYYGKHRIEIRERARAQYKRAQEERRMEKEKQIIFSFAEIIDRHNDISDETKGIINQLVLQLVSTESA